MDQPDNLAEAISPEEYAPRFQKVADRFQEQLVKAIEDDYANHLASLEKAE